MTIVTVNISDIKGRHPRYDDLFVQKSIDELGALKNSLMKDGKLNPVHLMKMEDQEGAFYIVDGVSTISLCDLLGITKVDAIIHEWSDDPIDLMIDLNTNEHRKTKELYMMAEALWKLLAPGQGKRSDLLGDESSTTSYDRIARRLKLKSGNLVKQLLRVGRTQESYFTDVDNGVTPLDKAYRDCVTIEKRRKEVDPSQSFSNYVSTATVAPSFSDPDTTDSTDPAVKFEYQDGFSKNIKAVLKSFQKLTDDEMKKLFNHLSMQDGRCVCCGKPNDQYGKEDVQL